ncbi:2-phosphosulfolactate phosphatase [Alteribacillus persepolensis]|uniref:Probable 2-phosphosulfolactate phosphatase n=1 Tax=Alteribacillus persepolensis TaxID=568899 RepID=A0A1G8JE97_9BACI|nr:2-phosphosulfolactate phosphatase [Alteribacillus persepolensis]SDI29371.1 2-phosphosulfolactate phosphatase [Alteribacillus persepolensis]
MRRITLLTRKEEMNPEKLKNCIVVVIDVLLATTTISTLLQYLPNSIIPVKDEEETKVMTNALKGKDYLLVGEKAGFEIEGFLKPDPLYLVKQPIKNKDIVLLTTNGTVALRKAAHAEHVYACAFINTASVAKAIQQLHSDQSVMIVCAGNSGRFSAEDFLCAGELINSLVTYSSKWMLSDAAKIAKGYMEKMNDSDLEEFLQYSETGKLLQSLNYENAIKYSVEKNVADVVPVLKDGAFYPEKIHSNL